MRLLQRAGHDRQRIEVVVLALPGHVLLRQQRFQHIERLVEDLPAVLERHPVTDELVRKGAAARANLDPPVGQNVGERNLRREPPHVVQRQHHDGRGNRDALGHRSHLDREGHRVRIHQDVDHVMLGHGHAAIAELLGRLCHLQHLAVHSRRRLGRVGEIAGKEEAEIHRVPPRRSVRQRPRCHSRTGMESQGYAGRTRFRSARWRCNPDRESDRLPPGGGGGHRSPGRMSARVR